MSDPARQRAVDSALQAALLEQVGALRYRHKQEQARRGAGTVGQPHPLRFDESGFPIKQRNSTLAQRLSRRKLEARRSLQPAPVQRSSER